MPSRWQYSEVSETQGHAPLQFSQAPDPHLQRLRGAWCLALSQRPAAVTPCIPFRRRGLCQELKIIKGKREMIWTVIHHLSFKVKNQHGGWNKRTRNRGQDWTWNEIDGKRDHLPLDKRKEKTPIRLHPDDPVHTASSHHPATLSYAPQTAAPPTLAKEVWKGLGGRRRTYLGKDCTFLDSSCPFFPPTDV